MIIAFRLKIPKKNSLVSGILLYRILSENYLTHKKVGFTYNFIFLSINKIEFYYF